MSLVLVAAMTWPGRVIGREGALPWALKADLARFKALTVGHPVVMGRRTWESLPFKLAGRSNLVLSRAGRVAFSPRGEAPDFLCAGLAEALALAARAPGGSEVFVIGGADVYAQALPLADRLALTLVHSPAVPGDALFPAFDPAAWTVAARAPGRQGGACPMDYEFLDLTRPIPGQGEA